MALDRDRVTCHYPSSGYRNRVRHSVLLHYNGTGWSQVTVPDTGGLVDVGTARTVTAKNGTTEPAILTGG